MKQRIDAIYENGLLRPLTPLGLTDHERVSITVETDADGHWMDQDAVEWAKQQGDAGITLEDVRRRLSKLTGSLSDVVIAERGEY